MLKKLSLFQIEMKTTLKCFGFFFKNGVLTLICFSQNDEGKLLKGKH